MTRLDILGMVIFFSIMSAVPAWSDTLTLQRPDGSTYQTEGEVKRYKENDLTRNSCNLRTYHFGAYSQTRR